MLFTGELCRILWIFFVCHRLVMVTLFVLDLYVFTTNSVYALICLNLLSLWLDASNILSNFLIMKKFLLLQSEMIAFHKLSTPIILESPFIIFLGISFASHLCWIPCFLDLIFFPFVSLHPHFCRAHPRKRVHRW